MEFEEKWEIYKKANLPNWLDEVGDEPPIDSLLAHKYDAFRAAWQASAENQRMETIEEVLDFLMDECDMDGEQDCECAYCFCAEEIAGKVRDKEKE